MGLPTLLKGIINPLSSQATSFSNGNSNSSNKATAPSPPSTATATIINMLVTASNNVVPRHSLARRKRVYVTKQQRTPLTTIPEDKSCEFIGDTNDFCSNFELVNFERRERNIPILVRSAFLDRLARNHALKMAEQQRVYHSVDNIQALKNAHRSEHVGENVQCGPSIRFMHARTMSDYNSAHRGNLLSEQFREIGIGMAKAEDGTFYICQKFRGS
jgi:uncharacterized protein YkwD